MYLRSIIITISALCFLQLISCSSQITSQLRDNQTEVVIGENEFLFVTPPKMTAIDSSRFAEIKRNSNNVVSAQDFELVGFFIEGDNATDSVNSFLQATQERYPIDKDLLAKTPRSVQIYLIDRGHWGFTEFDTLVKAYWKFKRRQWNKNAVSRTLDGVAYQREIKQKKIRTIENSDNAKIVIFQLNSHITLGSESFKHNTITAEGIVNINNTLFAIEVNSNYRSPVDTEWLMETTREILRSSGAT